MVSTSRYTGSGWYATTIGPQESVLVIAASEEWIDCDQKIACEQGWIELEEMR